LTGFPAFWGYAARSAFFLVKVAKRRTIPCVYRKSTSLRNAWRPVCATALTVQPLPPNRSMGKVLKIAAN
jgi:hypothetical protein